MKCYMAPKENDNSCASNAIATSPIDEGGLEGQVKTGKSPRAPLWDPTDELDDIDGPVRPADWKGKQRQLETDAVHETREYFAARLQDDDENVAAHLHGEFPKADIRLIRQLLLDHKGDWERVANLLLHDILPSAYAWAERNHIKHTMLNNGWCPHQINYLVKYYASDARSLREFAAIDRRVHRPEGHDACSGEQRCIAYNTPIDEDYQTQHAKDCTPRDCYNVKVPQKDLLRIIRSGGVPLVSIHETKTRHLSLRVHRRGFRSSYASISHVWADGLGNMTDNALPSCQIRRLRAVCTWTRENGPTTSRNWLQKGENTIFRTGRRNMKIWMDTLCIPCQPEHQELRLQCIDAMASIYAGSSTVFVFDKELEGTPMPVENDGLHALYLIAASVWMCRSWTLQEAILPTECIFEFADGFFRPTAQKARLIGQSDRLDEDVVTRERSVYHSSIISRMLLDFFELRRASLQDKSEGQEHGSKDMPERKINPSRESGEDGLDNFVTIWNQLAGRGTTKAEDLYVVLASCLDFKLRQFRHYPEMKEKMQRIIFSMQVLPMSLFFNAGPRLNAGENHYNRWIPTQVSNELVFGNGSTFSLPAPGVSKYSDEGMRLTLKFGADVIVLLVNSVWPWQSSRYSLSTDDSIYYIQADIPDDDKFDPSGAVATCTILEKFSLNGDSSRGAFFYVYEGTETTHLSLLYFCPLVARKRPLEHAFEMDARDSDHPPSLSATVLDTQSCKLWVKFKPIPGFKPLARQRRTQEFSEDFFSGLTTLPFFLCLVPGVLGMHLLTMPIWHAWGETIDSKYEPLLVLAYLLYFFLIGVVLVLLFGVYGFVTLRLRDYAFLYQSYDDNTVVDRIGRLVKAVFVTILQGMQRVSERLWKKWRRRPERVDVAL